MQLSRPGKNSLTDNFILNERNVLKKKLEKTLRLKLLGPCDLSTEITNSRKRLKCEQLEGNEISKLLISFDEQST